MTENRWVRILSRRGFRKGLWSILASKDQRRHVTRWACSLAPGYLLDAPSPWLVFDAIDFLASRVAPGIRVFEWGSGGSTLFWLQAGATVVSIEHDLAWHAVVRNRLAGVEGFDYRLVPPQPVSLAETCVDPSDPGHYASDDKVYAGLSFKDYASQIDEFPRGAFDLVLVDGRARPSCIAHGAAKVKPGGLLVLDNADRGYYMKQVARSLEGFARRRFFGAGPAAEAFWATDVYIKGADAPGAQDLASRVGA